MIRQIRVLQKKSHNFETRLNSLEIKGLRSEKARKESALRRTEFQIRKKDSFQAKRQRIHETPSMH